MFEIRCMGKQITTDKWIEGYYVHLVDDKGNETHRIYTGYAESDCGVFYPVWVEVDPSTISYVGLNDKNDKNVFH